MVSDTIELRGHIIDSLTLPKVLDQIVTRGATFNIVEFKIGQKRVDQSLARIEINPWMSRARGTEAVLAQKQWSGLHATLSKLSRKIELIPPQPRLPDMVFTANAGLAVGRQLIP